jgi:hypothetical protein
MIPLTPADLVCHAPADPGNSARHGFLAVFAEDIGTTVIHPLTVDPGRLAEHIAALVLFLGGNPAWIPQAAGVRPYGPASSAAPLEPPAPGAPLEAIGPRARRDVPETPCWMCDSGTTHGYGLAAFCAPCGSAYGLVGLTYLAAVAELAKYPAPAAELASAATRAATTLGPERVARLTAALFRPRATEVTTTPRDDEAGRDPGSV